jgi:hypothetical protein
VLARIAITPTSLLARGDGSGTAMNNFFITRFLPYVIPYYRLYLTKIHASKGNQLLEIRAKRLPVAKTSKRSKRRAG